MEGVSKETFEAVRKYAMAAEKMERFEHSIRVAETAKKMCRIYGQDEDKGYFAGMAHDICKDLDGEALVSFASRDGKAISDFEKRKPSLLHGRAAAVKLKRDFGVDDPSIIQSVAMHTFGGRGMCPLAKIVFAADKIEPGRPQSSEEYLERLFSMDLDSLVLSVVQENLTYLLERGREVATETYEFKADLEKSLNLKQDS